MVDFELVDSKAAARRAALALTKDKGLKLSIGKMRPRAIAVDMEGDLTKNGRASLLQVAGPRSSVVYVFDIQECPGILDEGEPLMTLLGGASTIKVMHDCRADADALRGQFKIDLQNVWDTQSAEMVLSGSESRVSLNNALKKYVGKTNELKDSVQHRPGLWEARPLPEKLLKYAAADVRDCIDLFVAQTKLMTAGQRTETKNKSMAQVKARLAATSSGKKAKPVGTKERVEPTAAAFFEHLSSSRERLIAVKTTDIFAEELKKWKASEAANKKTWRGGLGPILRSLVTKGLVKKFKQTHLTWTEAALSRTPPAEKASQKTTKFKGVKREAQQLAEKLVAERAMVERNKGGVVVDGPEDMEKVTASPATVLERVVTLKNKGEKNRLVKNVSIDMKVANSYRARFEILDLPTLPFSLPRANQITFKIKCTMPTHHGTSKALLSISFGTFAIGRFLEVTCGDSHVIDSLQPTSEYKPKKRRRRKLGDAVVDPPPPVNSSGMTPFPVALDHFKVPDSWRETLKLGEGGEAFQSSELFPLSFQTYVKRFSRLLWCEEDAQRDQLELFSMEGATMRATSARLELKVEGLAEKRPSVLRGDYVDVTCDLGHFRGVVETVERDRILLRFNHRLHKVHSPSTRYDVHFVFRRVPLRLAHQGLSKVGQLRQDVLFPTSPVKVKPEGHSYINQRLNELQRIAVDHVLAGAGTSAPYLLYGPPGTGKTTTLVEMVAQTVLLTSKKILVMAPTNAAADVVCERLHNIDGALCGSSLREDGKMLRLMAFSRSPTDVSADVLKHTTFTGSEFPTPSIKQVSNARVVIGTLATASKLHNQFAARTSFQCVFIDEAGQALEPECIAPLATLMTFNGQVVLAGDHQQLGPVVLSAAARNHGLALSYLERLSQEKLYQRDLRKYDKILNGYNPHAITMLTVNYRSHPDIIAVPNKLFYHEALEVCGDRSVTHCLANWEELPKAGVPVIFHHLVGMNTREASSPSWFNPDEAAQVLNYVQLLLKRGDIQPRDIGIIAPYHKQVQKIKKALTMQGIEVGPFGLKVGSTEMFQGQERRVIIISTVRSDPSFLEIDQTHNLGFVANAKRFNVAITRAEALLIVVGNAELLATDSNWESLLAHCKNKGAWVGEHVHLPSEAPTEQVAPISRGHEGGNELRGDHFVPDEETVLVDMMNKLSLLFAVAFD